MTMNSETVKTSVDPKVESDKVEQSDQPSEAMQVHDQIVKILEKYKNLESHIPLNHEYWGLLNRYRRLREEEKLNA